MTLSLLSFSFLSHFFLLSSLFSLCGLLMWFADEFAPLMIVLRQLWAADGCGPVIVVMDRGSDGYGPMVAMEVSFFFFSFFFFFFSAWVFLGLMAT